MSAEEKTSDEKALGAGACGARDWETGDECGKPGVAIRRACVHEHVRDGHLCFMHSMFGDGSCLACFEADGHDCPITVVLLAGEASK